MTTEEHLLHPSHPAQFPSTVINPHKLSDIRFEAAASHNGRRQKDGFHDCVNTPCCVIAIVRNCSRVEQGRNARSLADGTVVSYCSTQIRCHREAHILPMAQNETHSYALHPATPGSLFWLHDTKIDRDQHQQPQQHRPSNNRSVIAIWSKMGREPRPSVRQDSSFVTLPHAWQRPLETEEPPHGKSAKADIRASDEDVSSELRPRES